MVSISDVLYGTLQESCDQFDLNMMKTDAVFAAMERQLDINYKQAELKVFNESGTYDDLMYLREEAEGGFRNGIIKILTNIKDAVVQFFSKLKDKAVSIFSSEKIKSDLDKVDKKVKFIPFAKKQKIIVPDIDKQNKVSDETIAACEKLEAKVLSGQDIPDDAIEQIEEQHAEKMEKASGVSSAIQITLGNAVTVIKGAMKSAGSKLKTLEAYIIKGIEKIIAFFKRLIKGTDATSDEAQNAAITKIERVKAKVGQEKGSNLLKFIADCCSSLKDKAKGLFGGKKKDAADEQVKAESYEDDLIYRSFYEEEDEELPTSDEDASAPDVEEDTSFESMYNDFFGESEDGDVDTEYATGKKPSNESLVDSIFRQIMGGKTEEDSAGDKLYESTYDRLLREIEDL